ncbi:MAG: hypothetical protein J6C56_06245 [Alistipes sp.]|nr:hypothetical protein [Alistipes sp.]
MSIFRPHKTKPRQFNYTPRFYDPQKEAMEQRRRELHGTSSESDNMPYQPGNYLRTQRDARREARESDSNAATNRLLRYALLIIIVGMAMMYLFPRITSFLERIMQQPNAVESVEGGAEGRAFSSDADAPAGGGHTMILNEQHGDIDFTEFETLSPEIINEIEEWNQNHTLTIYSDDVEIVDGKRVEK